MTKKATRKRNATDKAAKPALSRRRRRAHHATLAALIGIALGMLLVTRSGLLKFILIPQLESRLSCEATCGRVILDSSGELVIRDLTLNAPGVDGPAGRFLFAPEARIEIAMDSWWPGSIRVGRIKLYEPTVRISQAEDLSLNVSDLFGSTAGAPSGNRIPEVIIREGSLELGEHGNGNFVPILSLGVRGGIAADQTVNGLYKIDLVGDPKRMVGATGAVDTHARTHLEGSLDLNKGSFDLHAADINLTELTARSAPRSFRGYWEQLRLKGQIPTTSLTYNSEDGLSAQLDLSKVNLAIPVPVTVEEEIAGQVAPSTENEALDMEDVSGQIKFDRRGLRATLKGNVEDLACTVSLQTQGLSMDSPLSCRIETDEFAIIQGQRPRLLPFAPAFVQKILRRFSSPGATLKGSVVIRRVLLADGQPEWRYEGAFDLHDGQAQYEQFPYPFDKIEATFIFDQDKFEMPRISGVGRGTGAKLLASGLISPPNEEAEVHVDITVIDVPMDQVFKQSLPEHARAVYDVLFSDKAYEADVAAQRILDPKDIEAKRTAEQDLQRRMAALESQDTPEARDEFETLRPELDQLRASLDAPEFALGGKARLRVLIHRPMGHEQHFTSDIQCDIPSAGIMPSAFPYPAVAQNVSIHMADGLATINPCTVAGLTGAAGTLDGRVDYSLEPGGEYHPHIRIQAQSVPLDAFLIDALPEGAGLGETSLPQSPREMLKKLNIAGSVSCDARIGPTPDGAVGFDVSVGIDHLTATPSPDLVFDEVTGSLEVSNTTLRVERIDGLLGGRPFTLDLSARFKGAADPNAPRFAGSLAATDLDLAQPIESILSLAAPEQAEALASLRSAHSPAGRLNARFTFAERDDGLDYTLNAEHLQDIAFDAFGARIHLNDTTGAATISNDEATFDRFQASVVAENASEEAEPTRVSLDGTFARRPGVPGTLRIEVGEGRCESPVLRAIAATMNPEAGRVIDQWKPAGRFDLQAQRTTSDDAGAPPVITWAVEPRSLSFEHRGKTITFQNVSGRIARENTAGRIDNLRLEADGWTATADGSFTPAPEIAADVRLGLEVHRITPELIAALPGPVADVVDAIDLSISQHLALSGARLRYRPDAPDGEIRTAFEGALQYAGLAAKPGVSISDAGGTASVHYEQRTGADKPDFSVEMNADFFRVLGVEMTDAHARLEQGESPDVHLLRRFEAQSNGGRISGYAAFADARRMNLGVDGRSYEIHTEVSGVRFGPLLAQMKPSGGDDAPADRGIMDASFSIFGAFADESSRRGRGTVRVEGGDVLNMPGIVPLLELSNLQPPANEKVDLAFTDFFITGDKLLFEDLYLYSPSIRITGAGQMGWPSTELDLRIETRGMRQIPILSEILTSLREEIVSTRVTGTLYHPQFRYEQLSGARRLFGAVLGGHGEEREPR